MYPAEAGIWDNYCVKKQLLNSCTVISSNLLIVDEVRSSNSNTAILLKNLEDQHFESLHEFLLILVLSADEIIFCSLH